MLRLVSWLGFGTLLALALFGSYAGAELFLFCRFFTVTDRILAELGPVTLGLIAKDQDNKFENPVRGMGYIQIKARTMIRTYEPLNSHLAIGLAT